MDRPGAAINEVRGNGFHIIYDHQQQQLRQFIESYRILPNNCTFSQLDETLQQDIKTHCRNYKPVCPSGNHNHKCSFRYIDNASISKTLQPRYACKTCNRTFTLFGRSYMAAAIKRSLENDDEKLRRNRIKKKCEDLAAARYTTSGGHDDELSIRQPHTHKTTSTTCIRGLACCGRSQNQLYESRSRWSLGVQRSPLQHHNILSSCSTLNSQTFPSSLFFVSNENYDHHMLPCQGGHAIYPSIFRADLMQRSYRPFESVNEFGISLQENNLNDTRDEMGTSLRNVMTEEGNNYEYSPHGASVFPTSLSTSCETCRAQTPTTCLHTHFQGDVPEGEQRRGKPCEKVEVLEIQAKDYINGYQNGNINFSACLPLSSCPPCLSNGNLSRTNEKDLYLSTTVAVDYPIHPNRDRINYQNNIGPAYLRVGCEEMIKEYTQKADYGSKDGENEIADLCGSIFDMDQSKLLNEILPKPMNSTYENSCCVSLDELIDIDDIIIDSPLHASTPSNNNIEALNHDDSYDFKKTLNDESLTLEGRGFEQVVGAKKTDEIEVVQNLSVENFNCYDHEFRFRH